MRTALRRRVTGSIVTILFATGLPAHALDDWQSFAPGDASFRIEMPAAPATQTKERGFPPFDFVSTVYTARVGDDAFGLNHTDLPRLAFYFRSESSIFDSAREGFLEESDASGLSFDEIEFSARPARKLIYDIPATEERPALRGQARMFFERNRLYIVWAEVTSGISAEEIERYFDSFQVGER